MKTDEDEFEKPVCSFTGCDKRADWVETYNDKDCKVAWCNHHRGLVTVDKARGYGIRRL